MLPSESDDPPPLNDTGSGIMPDAGEAAATAAGGRLPLPAGIRNRVMLCCGAVVVTLLPLKLRSLRRVVTFDEVSCQRWATPWLTKSARLSVTGVLPDRYVLITADRVAAGAGVHVDGDRRILCKRRPYRKSKERNNA